MPCGPPSMTMSRGLVERAVVQEQRVAVRRLQRFEREHSSHGASGYVALDRLQRPQRVDHAGALEVALATEIGRGAAQDAFDPRRLADELAMPRHEERRDAAHVRRGHARAVLGAVGVVRHRRVDPLAGPSTIRFDAVRRPSGRDSRSS